MEIRELKHATRHTHGAEGKKKYVEIEIMGNKTETKLPLTWVCRYDNNNDE